MGLLTIEGKAFTYEESKQHQKKLKKLGVKQFIKLMKTFEKTAGPKEFNWGYEIEYQLIKNFHSKQQSKIQVNSDRIIQEINHQNYYFISVVEYGAWMLEIIPQRPYNCQTPLNRLSKCLQYSKKLIESHLNEDEVIQSLSVFPILGRYDYYVPYQNDATEFQNNPYSQSTLIHDEIINKHPRFPYLSHNIRQRRQEKVKIQIPMYKDLNTKNQTITMDAMAFGMGNCCLQTTFSCTSLAQARYMHDQMAVWSPLFMCLSASSPIYNGFLSDIDCRWKVISQSVDCRTALERDPKSNKYMPKSRYDSISFYINRDDDPMFKSDYNDTQTYLDPEILELIEQEQKVEAYEIDKTLKQHLQYMFSRDAMVIFENAFDDTDNTKMFENLNSTNWNSVRFKPPPSLDSQIPWRVEFRTMEVQMTQEANAAFIFLSLKLVQLLQNQDYNFYIPISLVDKNFERAHRRDAVLKQKFYVRLNIFDNKPPKISELNIRDIFFGNFEYVGLYELLKQDIIKKSDINNAQLNDIDSLFKGFLEDIVTGKKPTFAAWIRQFIKKHPNYRQDSIITEKMNYDLINEISRLQSSEVSKESCNGQCSC